MKNHFQIITLSSLLTISSCAEIFNPNIPNSEASLFVVDGVITDQPGPYSVTISKSSKLNEDNTFVSGANVLIEEENGLSEQLEETEPGTYQTKEIIGIPGNRYRVKIDINGEQIESSWEELTNSSSFDNLYFAPETKYTTDKDVNEIGLQFFVDSHGDIDDPRYYRFEWYETWRIGVRWSISYDYVGNDMTVNTETDLDIVCWKSDTFQSINLASTTELTENILSGHKLGFINNSNDRFTKRYSIEVKQYSLTPREYSFWKALKESNLGLGGGLENLFLEQPEKVPGNLTNISNPSNDVLGYFSASGVQSKRIFIDPQDIPRELSRQIKCPLDSIFKFPDIRAYHVGLFVKIRDGALFYDFIYSPTSIDPVGALLSTLECSDCTENGGSVEKPNFWDE